MFSKHLEGGKAADVLEMADRAIGRTHFRHTMMKGAATVG